jgi:hypothetical protein
MNVKHGDHGEARGERKEKVDHECDEHIDDLEYLTLEIPSFES